MDTRNMSNERYIELYLSYFNDFLTIDRFADYYGFDLLTAKHIIYKGRELNNAKW